jgi:hypothetical protein
MSNAGTTLQREQGFEAQTHKIDRPIHPTREGLNQIYTSLEGILLTRQANTVDWGRAGAREDICNQGLGTLSAPNPKRAGTRVSKRYIQQAPLALSLGIAKIAPLALSLGIAKIAPLALSLGIAKIAPLALSLGIAKIAQKTPVIEVGRGRATGAYSLLGFGG